MEKRSSRVSDAQWAILLDYIESHPGMAKARGYNNSAKGRAESTRLWQELATLLNAEGTGPMKTPKDWAVYVSNYKSKLKKNVAGINADAVATGGGPPQSENLSEYDKRFLAILGPGFGQSAPHVRVNPFPDEEPQPSSSEVVLPDIGPIAGTANIPNISCFQEMPPIEIIHSPGVPDPFEEIEVETENVPPGAAAPSMPRQTRQRRYRSRPLAPLDEARRILSQVEMKRAEADAAKAQALCQIADKLGLIAENMASMGEKLERFVSAFEIYVDHITLPSQ